jgi:crotonobetainyl-CoA:carnitine CoA-transferase CaiB-like acyl-CoA transferase
VTRPLAGIRVLDFGIVGTGPKTGLLLASFGADVIKIESPAFPDPYRFAEMRPNGAGASEDIWNVSAGSTSNNRGKRSLCLDFHRPEGAALLDALIGTVDIVLHNFRMSVADKLGLCWDRLRGLNPRLILVAASSQGDDGPNRDFGSYGTTLEGIGGIASLTGYPDGEPLITGINFPDQACPLLLVGAITGALLEREETGEGSYLDFAQLEAAVALVGDQLIDYQLTGEVPVLRGNAEAGTPFQGAVRCAGEDNWVAVTVRTEQQAAALKRLVADAAPGANGFRDRANGDAAVSLDARLESWASARPAGEVEALLVAAGIPAAVVARGAEVLVGPQLSARGYFDRLTHPLVGERLYNGNPIGLRRWENRPARAAALLGEHNREVLSELLGLSEAQLDRLEEAGVLATQPAQGSR